MSETDPLWPSPLGCRAAVSSLMNMNMRRMGPLDTVGLHANTHTLDQILSETQETMLLYHEDISMKLAPMWSPSSALSNEFDIIFLSPLLKEFAHLSMLLIFMLAPTICSVGHMENR